MSSPLAESNVVDRNIPNDGCQSLTSPPSTIPSVHSFSGGGEESVGMLGKGLL